VDAVQGLGVVVEVALLAKLILGDAVFAFVRDVHLLVGKPGDGSMTVRAEQLVPVDRVMEHHRVDVERKCFSVGQGHAEAGLPVALQAGFVTGGRVQRRARINGVSGRRIVDGFGSLVAGQAGALGIRVVAGRRGVDAHRAVTKEALLLPGDIVGDGRRPVGVDRQDQPYRRRHHRQTGQGHPPPAAGTIVSNSSHGASICCSTRPIVF
jgi:hypothetical protein